MMFDTDATVGRRGLAEIVEMAEVHRARAAFYRTLERLYLKPCGAEDVERLKTGIAAMGEGAYTGDAALDGGLRRLAGYLDACGSNVREDLACDYTAAFYGVQTVAGRAAVPYESAFEPGCEQRLMGPARQAVYNVYKKCRLRLGAGLDIPEDHISFEFEFLAIMADRVAAALERVEADDVVEGGGECGRRTALEEALGAVGLSEAFLAAHPTRWFDDFAALAGAIVQEGFYPALFDVTRGFLVLDAESLADCRESLACELGVDPTEALVDITVWERPPAKGAELSAD